MDFCGSAECRPATRGHRLLSRTPPPSGPHRSGIAETRSPTGQIGRVPATRAQKRPDGAAECHLLAEWKASELGESRESYGTLEDHIRGYGAAQRASAVEDAAA